MNVLSLFDGMSCGRIALERAGIPVANYFASEIDQYAIQVAQTIYPDTHQLGDIKNYQEWDLTKIDIVIGGSPCQDLSRLKNAGTGLDGDKSILFFDFVKACDYFRPQYILMENVVPSHFEWTQQISKILGIDGILINSDIFVPQNRPRMYWTNIPIGPLPIRPLWNFEYYQYRRTYYRKNQSGVCPCLTANMGTGGHNVPLHSKNLKDKLTVKECALLQGIPESIIDKMLGCGVSNSQLYKMLGNGWTINVIAHILKGINK